MTLVRSGGILLHPTSLSGPYGIGDMGPEAHAFIDWLSATGCRLWQILPLGPTGYGNSPYQCLSTFAGNPLLISPQLLVRDGLLDATDIELQIPDGSKSDGAGSRVDFDRVIPRKMSLLERAHRRFEATASKPARHTFEAFCARNAAWLDDFSLYMALKQQHRGLSWTHWAPVYRHRSVEALAAARNELADVIARHSFIQMLFFQQWSELREHAARAGIEIIGDLPIFVSEDSADIWANRRLFKLDPAGLPTVVAGVPPDYFSPTGQLWGNPVHDWASHRASEYVWWLARLRSVLALVDFIRLDHFRGFAGYWEIPSSATTAETGSWVPGPAEDFLDALTERLPMGDVAHRLPLIAEDLGVVTPDVIRLLLAYDLPGMRVLQFGFAGLEEDFLPHNYVNNCVAYTGTHDNDTTRGWFDSAPELEQRLALDYLKSSRSAIVGDMIEAVWASAAGYAIVPMQDVLELGPRARMNFPGLPEGNWEWRLEGGELTEALAERLGALNAQHSRAARGRSA